MVIIILAITVIAQAPQAFKYQAVVRDNTGEIIASQEVSFRISIHDETTAGAIVYQETHQETTNEFGLVNLEIGNGEPESCFWSDIDWSTGDKFLEVELDPDGGSAYISMGTTQLLAVPYALYSESTGDTTRWRKGNDDDLYYDKGTVGIGTEIPDESALLDLNSNTKGFLPPRLTNAERDAIFNPSEGLFIYNIEKKICEYFNGITWVQTYYPTSNQIECGQDFIDSRDGSTYKTVQIGTQCWMVENLNIGTIIFGTSTQTNNGIIERYCYDDLESNCDIYGGLYQWYEMMQYTTSQGTQGICPPDWHLPTDEEWKQLEGEVDSWYGYPDPEWDGTGWRGFDAGLNLISASGWYSGIGTDPYGFTALPGGLRHTNGSFGNLTLFAYFWSSSEDSGLSAWKRALYYSSNGVFRNDDSKSYGFSVRCLQD